jgi:hypothetical protein
MNEKVVKNVEILDMQEESEFMKLYLFQKRLEILLETEQLLKKS